MPKAGLPKKYAKMGFKKGWKAFKASKRGRSAPKPKKTRAVRVRRAASRARTGVRKRMGGLNTNSIFAWIRRFALIGPAAAVAMSSAPADEKIKQGLKMYTSWDMNTGQADFATAFETYKPYLFTALVTYGIPRLSGIIRGLFK